jgi:predicted RecA/RadA family phage recombinase
MATARFIHDGHSIDYTPGSNVSAGDVVVQEKLVGVAKRPIAAGALGALAVSGVFDFPKATGGGTAIAAGQPVYWDGNNEVVTTNGDLYILMGHCVAAAGDDDTTARVRLNSTNWEPPV